MTWLSIGALLLVLLLTLLTLATVKQTRRIGRDSRAADIGLRRIAGRVRLGEHVAAGQRVKEDVTEVSTTAAVGVARLVSSVVRGMTASRKENPRPPADEPNRGDRP